MSNYLFEDFLPEIQVAAVSSEIVARPYQVEAIDAAFVEWKSVASTLIVMPTGTGKSVVFAKILRRWLEHHMGRVMILAHRKELIAQAKAHAEAAGASCDIEMASSRASNKCDVVAASIQTLNAGTQCYECEGVNSGDCHVCGGSGRLKRMTRFDPRDFGLIITDEAHHCHIAGTMVETIEGPQSIESLRVGQGVYSWDCITERIKPIVGKYRYCYDGPVIEIVTRSGTVTVTPNHRMLCHGEQIEASEIREGMFISLPVVRYGNNERLRDSDALPVESSGMEALSSMPGSHASGRDCRTRGTAQTRQDSMLGLRGDAAENVAGRTHDIPPWRELFHEPGSSRESHGETVAEYRVHGRNIAANESAEPDAIGGRAGENDRISIEEHSGREVSGIRERSEVRQREREDSGGNTDVQSVSGCGIQSRRDNGGRSDAVSLQDRSGLAMVEGRVGTRRHVTCGPDEVGQTERGSACGDRLEDCQGSERRSRLDVVRVDSVITRHHSGFVYDIEVADTHNYVANGLLSSNSTADSYMDVYSWFGRNEGNKRLFVTATPERADGNGLHNVCESVAYEMQLRTAIDDGWLVPIRQQFIEVAGLDLSRVSTRQGDLADGELERAFLGEDDADQERMLHAIAKPVLDISAGQQFIVFASGVKHAELLLAAFNAYDGSRVEMILGSTEAFERQRIVARLKSGVTQGLVNVGVATEGFDCPAVAVVAIARPTKSTPLYLQMIGRGTRPLPGVVDGPATPEARKSAIEMSAKQTCLVLDFVGNSGRHKLVSVVDVLAGADVDERDVETAIRLAKKSDVAQDMDALLEKAKTAREAKERAAEEKRKLSTHRKADYADVRTTDVDLFGGRKFDAFQDYTPSHPNAASQAQVNYLVKLGVSPAKAINVSKGQAGAMITAMKNRVGGEFVIPFGKHAGKPINQIPAGYLSWMIGGGINSPEIIGHVETFLRERQ